MMEDSEQTPLRIDIKNENDKQFDDGETAVFNTLTADSLHPNQSMFDAIPVSLWKEDFSEVKKFIDRLQQNGVTDLRTYFNTHPESIAHCISLVRVIDVNQAALKMYKAKSKEVLLNNFDKIFGTEAFSIFKEELIVIGQGGTLFESEGINYTLDGTAIDVAIRWSVTPGFEASLSQIIVCSIDITNAKRASEQLRLQSAALESAANAIVITDDNGNILWVNPAFTRLTGYSYNEVLGKNPRILKSGKNSEALYHELWTTIKADQVWHGKELINRHKDGTLYYEQMTIAPVKDENGQISRFVAIKENITERKQLEMQLRRQLHEEEVLYQVVSLTTSKSEFSDIISSVCEKLAHFFNIPSCSFAMLDEECMFADVVAEYVDTQVISSEINLISIINIMPLDLLMAQKSALLIKDVHTAPIMESVWDILGELDNFSAFIIPVLIDGKIKGAFEFDTVQSHEFTQDDISFAEQVATQISQTLQRIRAKEELAAERDFAHQVMNNMGQGLLVLTKERTIRYCNPAFGKILGYENDDLIGKPMMTLLSASEIYSSIQPTSEENQSNKFVREVVLQHATGKEVNVLLTAVPRQNNINEGGAIVVVTDLSQQKKIEQALADARDQAIEASRLKSEFLANMSHEIRTPLNAIIGMTSLMLDSRLTPELHEFAETIRSSGDVLLSLINDILDFSKIEAGKLELEERPFTIRHCVEEALDVVVTKASEKGLELAYIIDDLVPHDIVGDVTRVRQIFVNLLNNAIKFTDSGEVVLSVACLPDQTKSKTSKMLQFSVTDTGIGIPEDRLNRLFKSFSQVDASTTRRFGGTGLGLAISKQLVEMMGGNIWVESEVGKGSTFHFTIVAKVANSERHIFTQKTQSHLSGKRLLIVDDNATNRKILKKQADLWQMLPQAVASGPEAIRLLQQGELFDCAILDMQMPEMDGLMLAAEIRKFHDEKALPLVMLSSIGDRDEFKESNYFAAFLTKPIKQQFLLETLMGVLSDTAVSTSQTPNKLTIDPDMGKKHPLRILLAEDNLVNQKVASRILERMGYRADIAADGLEVLEALQRQPYDVVLMDVQMPYMDGVEATEQIRDIWPPEQQPKIIAMTAHALTGDREKYLEAGMDQYISKPVRIQELLQALMNCTPLAS